MGVASAARLVSGAQPSLLRLQTAADNAQTGDKGAAGAVPGRQELWKQRSALARDAEEQGGGAQHWTFHHEFAWQCTSEAAGSAVADPSTWGYFVQDFLKKFAEHQGMLAEPMFPSDFVKKAEPKEAAGIPSKMHFNFFVPHETISSNQEVCFPAAQVGDPCSLSV